MAASLSRSCSHAVCWKLPKRASAILSRSLATYGGPHWVNLRKERHWKARDHNCIPQNDASKGQLASKTKGFHSQASCCPSAASGGIRGLVQRPDHVAGSETSFRHDAPLGQGRRGITFEEWTSKEAPYCLYLSYVAKYRTALTICLGRRRICRRQIRPSLLSVH